ncbi:MAG: peptidoglycan bridge formation glycyltransferase FemA/FemB family protein [Bacilli bacterium]
MIIELNDQEFNEYSKQHECNTFFQTSYWGQLKKTNGWNPIILGMKEDNKIICASLLLRKKIPIFKKYFYYAPRGFLINFKNKELLNRFTIELEKYLKNNKAIFLKINPYLSYQQRDIDGTIVLDKENNKEVVENLKQLGFNHAGFTITYGKELEPRWISVLDLNGQNEPSLLENMRATTRWVINNSYKHGLKLVEINNDRMNEFKELMAHTGERRGFIDRPLSYYKLMYEIFSKDNNIKVMLVELNIKEHLEKSYKQKEELLNKIEEISTRTSTKSKRQLKELESQFNSCIKKIEELEQIKTEKGNKIVVAGGLFMIFGTQVISLFGASYKEYMKYNGQYFLNFEMIKYALNNNYQKYNFLGITGEFTEESKMFGLFDFKRGFNSEVVELIGEFTLVVNKFYFNIYNIMLFIYKKLKKWRMKI